jgi:hypothetical protein
MTTRHVSAACVSARRRPARFDVTSSTCSATHVAQATCSEGIAAYRSGETVVALSATSLTTVESMKPTPGISRGGATGKTQNTMSATELMPTSALRAER